MATISKRGDRWRAQVRRRGLKPLSATFETKARAQSWATQTEAEILAGKRGEYPNKSFADALDRYLAEESIKKAGYRWEKIRIEAFKRSTLAYKRVSLIAPDDIAAWRNDRLRAVSGATVRREMALLGAIFDIARREWKWCAINPLQDVTKPPSSPERKRGVRPDEIERVCSQLTGPQGKQVASAFRLAIETAMRKGELLALRWDQIQANVAFLPRTKNGDARFVALSSEALRILETLRSDPATSRDTVFYVRPDIADTLFRKAVRKAGIPDLHFHDSRSEAITRLSRRLDVMELARQVGHRDLKSLLIYYAPSAADIARKLD